MTNNFVHVIIESERLIMSYLKNEHFLHDKTGVTGYKRITRVCMDIYFEDGSIIRQLYDTPIVVEKDGVLTLNTGGFHTQTIARYIEDYPNFPNGRRILSRNHTLYYSDKYNRYMIDGIKILSSTGELVLAIGDKNRLKTIEKIKQFVNKLDDMDLPYPSPGDCWYCLMGNPLNHSCLKSHLEEGHLHGSLLVNAMLEAGYQKEGIAIMYHRKNKDAFKRALKKYMIKYVFEIPKTKTRTRTATVSMKNLNIAK